MRLFPSLLSLNIMFYSFSIHYFSTSILLSLTTPKSPLTETLAHLASLFPHCENPPVSQPNTQSQPQPNIPLSPLDQKNMQKINPSKAPSPLMSFKKSKRNENQTIVSFPSPSCLCFSIPTLKSPKSTEY